MFEFFDNFFQMKKNYFDRPIRDDANSYSVYPVKDGYILMVNTLGIAKENLQIQLIRSRNQDATAFNILNIYGTTKVPEVGIVNNVKFQFLLNFSQKIKDMSYSCKDGLTFITIKLESTENETISMAENVIINSNEQNAENFFDF